MISVVIGLSILSMSVMPYHSAERTSTVVHFYVIRQLNAILLLGENFHVSNYYFVLNKQRRIYRGAEPPLPPSIKRLSFGRRTDAVTRYPYYNIMSTPSPFLSLPARKTWYSECSK